LNRRLLRSGAFIGAAAVSLLAVAPVFAAAPVSQSSAQAINLSIAGNSVISQEVTASHDGTSEESVDNSTIPTLVDLLPVNTALAVGVAPQEAVANADGTSYACAGIAGTGGGLVKVGNERCELNGEPLTLDLGSLDLGTLPGPSGALTTALEPLLGALGPVLDQVVDAVVDGIADTPLGEIGLTGSLSAIEGSCYADPDAAVGDTRLVDSSGGSDATPISVSLPGVAEPIVLLNLPANPPPNTHVLVNLDTVTQTLIDALTVQLNTMVQGALVPLAGPLVGLLQQVQDQVVVVLVDALQPLLQPLQENVLDILLNKQVVGDAGRSIEVTALEIDVLPALAQFAGGSLVGGEIGKVSCGPNTRVTVDEPDPDPTPTDGTEPPTVVDSGARGDGNTARTVLTATAALTLLAGTAGLIGYRRMLIK
jgi:hypothetical protein